MSYPELIETERLTLRRIRPTDAEAYRDIWSDRSVWESLRASDEDDPLEVAAASHAKQVRHWDEHGFGLWAVVPSGEPTAVGWVGAWYPDFVPDLRGEIEIGWTLRTPFRGQGYATEAAQRAIDAIFEHHNPDRVISLISPTNAPSAAVAARLGMRQATEAQTEHGLILRVFELRRGG